MRVVGTDESKLEKKAAHLLPIPFTFTHYMLDTTTFPDSIKLFIDVMQLPDEQSNYQKFHSLIIKNCNSLSQSFLSFVNPCTWFIKFSALLLPHHLAVPLSSLWTP